jgi:hypothetical protein
MVSSEAAVNSVSYCGILTSSTENPAMVQRQMSTENVGAA